MANILTGDVFKKISKSDDRVVVYGNGDLVLAEGITECSQMRIRMIGFLLCLKGCVQAIEHDKTITINENDILIYHPNVFLELKYNPDVRLLGIFFSPDYIKNMIFVPVNMWDVLCFFEKSSIITLDKKNTGLMCQYYDFIKARILDKPTSYGDEIICSLVQALLYQLRDVIGMSVKLENPNFSSSERLFNEFTRIIMSLYPRPRSVSYYADKLNVTPKHLSAVCKEISGKTASDIITSFVIKDVKFLLTRTEKGIKEITHELEFSSISFFGKYVKKNLGMSPKHYREKFYEKA